MKYDSIKLTEKAKALVGGKEDRLQEAVRTISAAERVKEDLLDAFARRQPTTNLS